MAQSLLNAQPERHTTGVAASVPKGGSEGKTDEKHQDPCVSSNQRAHHHDIKLLRATAQGSSASHIRSRFLSKLGISKSNSDSSGFPTTCGSPLRNAHRCMDRSSSGPRLIRADSFQEHLKADYGKPDTTLIADDATSCTTDSVSEVSTCGSAGLSTSPIAGKKPRSVSFDSSVTVHPIPRYSDYSSRIRNTIWTSVEEMQESAARNYYEFAAENWDWRQVAEDQDMIIYHGERIHPVHFAMEQEQLQRQQQFSLRNQFFAVLSAQQQGY